MSEGVNPKELAGEAKAGISNTPIEVLATLGLSMTEGALKYGRFNYRDTPIKGSVYVDAIWRHVIVQWWAMSEDIDEQSGIHHIDKAISTLVVLRDSISKGTFHDDRPPAPDKQLMARLNLLAGQIHASYHPSGPTEEQPEGTPGNQCGLREQLGGADQATEGGSCTGRCSSC